MKIYVTQIKWTSQIELKKINELEVGARFNVESYFLQVKKLEFDGSSTAEN